MAERVRIGVIGAGLFATTSHMPALLKSDEAEIAAICRRDEAALAKVGDRFGIPASGRFTEHERMLDEAALDAVVVSSPHALHYSHTRAALERGLPVLTDKPLAVRTENAEELRALATKKNLPLIVAFGPPYQPAWRAIREWITGGELGRIEAIQQTRASNIDAFGFFGRGALPPDAGERWVVPPTSFRASSELGGGGYFQDVGSHAVGGILVATDLVPVEVQATMDNPDVDLRAAVTITCAEGAVITTTIIGNAFPEEQEKYRDVGTTLVMGSRGSVFQSGRGKGVVRQKWDGTQEEVGPDQLPEPLSPAQHFIDVLRGRAQPIVSLDRAVTAVRVIEASYRSARERRPVNLV